MAYSKIGICNISLAMLGAESIRAFNEPNKRARMCDVFYDVSVTFLLSNHDWSFARKYSKLNALDLEPEEIPFGNCGFQLPSDCLTPRSIDPPGSRTKWQISGRVLFTDQTSVGLHYTSNDSPTSIYNDQFAMLASLYLAVKIAPSITQNPRLTAVLQDQYTIDRGDAWESDSNIGNDYRFYDEDPNKDTFVNPEGHLEDDRIRFEPS